MSVLTNEQRKLLSNKQINVVVNPFEQEVLREIRKYSHGRVTVVIMDGVPYRIEYSHSKMLFDTGDGVSTLQKVKEGATGV